MATDFVSLVLNDMLGSFADVIPNVLGAAVLLFIGWLLGKILGDLTRRALKKLKVDKYFKIDKGFRPTEILSVIVSWIIYLLFIQEALRTLGIITLSIFFGQVMSLIAGLFGGVIILMVGYLIAKYTQKQAATTKSEFAGLFSQIMFFFVMIITISIAFDVANIPTRLIDSIILILVAAVGLGIAIALGLGLKDTVSKLAKKYEKKL